MNVRNFADVKRGFHLKSNNLEYNMMGRWVNGPNDSLTKHLMFQVLFLIDLYPIHVVTFTLISNLATDYIQKTTGQALLFSSKYNLSPNLISK